MPKPIRIASFNVENLLSRAKALDFVDNAEGDEVLADVERLRCALAEKTYNGRAIVELYHALREYVDVVEVREKLFNRTKTDLVAHGVDDWAGFIEFKREKLSEEARRNTARVLREVNADVLCLVEVESRPVLQHFCVDRLPRTGKFASYEHLMLIDGNDDRGIDVSLASRFPIRRMRSHVDDPDDGEHSHIFSRDCLELEVVPDDGGDPIHFLLNHLKSKGYGSASTSDDKRRRQAKRVAEILGGYDLGKDRVVLCGDFNDTPDSAALAPLLGVPDLYDVLKETVSDPGDRWTYHYRKNEQIDYLLVSRPLRERLVTAGIERRGMAGVEQYSGGAVHPFDSVTGPSNEASDHGAVWADFDL